MTTQPANTQADLDIATLVRSMRAGVDAGPEIYRPGELWDSLIAANLEMLRTDGIANFKRTVSNNYYNWLVTSPRNEQIQQAAKGWLRHPTIAPLTNRLQEPPSGLRTLDQEGSYALSAGAAWRYKFFVGATWETARRADRIGLTNRLSEPVLGNPIRISHRGRLVSQDLANSILEFEYAARAGVVREGARVAELGAGYGRLAHVFAEACDLTYCIFDIPPALAVSQWYLTQLLGDTRTVAYAPGNDFAKIEPRLKRGVVAFFTPDQIEMFPDGWFDLTQSISTLVEMPAPQAQHYLRVLPEKSRAAVFMKQWKHLHNSADDTDMGESDYTLPPPWRLVARRTDPIQPAFFNRLWKRSR
jgi:putative sugar O-methyltransferase